MYFVRRQRSADYCRPMTHKGEPPGMPIIDILEIDDELPVLVQFCHRHVELQLHIQGDNEVRIADRHLRMMCNRLKETNSTNVVIGNQLCLMIENYMGSPINTNGP